MVHITSHISGHKRVFGVKYEKNKCIPNNYITYSDILIRIHEKEGSCSDVSLFCEGKPVTHEDQFTGDANIVATLKLHGGKGGFGSMLRAIGAQIEKTTNREACRDLSGRRLRDINEEKRLKDYLAKKVEKEKDMFNQKKKKLEQLKEGPKHVFEDKSYFDQREKRERDIYDSLDKAFSSDPKPCSSAQSQNGATAEKSGKRKRLLDDLDDSSSNEESESEDETKKEESDSDDFDETSERKIKIQKVC